MATRTVVLADRIIGPLRSSDRSYYAPVLRIAGRATEHFQAVPIVLLGFRRQELLDLFSGCLFLNNPEHLATRVPETYLACMKYIPADEHILFVEADSDLSVELLEALAFDRSGLLYAASLAKPPQRRANLYVRAEDRARVEGLMRQAGRDQEAMLARLAAELSVLVDRPQPGVSLKVGAIAGATSYDQQ